MKICDKCDKSFRTNWHLQRHLNNKKGCRIENPEATEVNPKAAEMNPKAAEVNPKAAETNPKTDISTPEFQCHICSKLFSTQSNCNKHMHKCKYTEDDICNLEKQVNGKARYVKPNECRYCERTFSNTYGATKHMKICKAKAEYKAELEAKLLAKNVSNNITNNNINNINNINNTTNNTTNNINNINITVNPIGRENVAYMTCAVIKDIMRKSRSNEAFIANTLAYIHAHDEHPENHNIIVSNHRSNMALVKRKDKYEYENINTVMQETSNSWLDKVCIEDDFDEVPLSIKQKYESVCENDELDAKAASIFKSKLYANYKGGVITKPTLEN
jgi:hypothetical protein